MNAGFHGSVLSKGVDRSGGGVLRDQEEPEEPEQPEGEQFLFRANTGFVFPRKGSS